MSIHISQAYARLNDEPLNAFAMNVGALMLANIAIYATPLVPLATLNAGQAAFQASMTAMDQSGTAATAVKDASRLALINLLRTQSFYVQELPGMTEAKALLSGYLIAETGAHAPVSLVTPVITKITNVAPGSLGIGLQGSHGATGYEFRIAIGAGAPAHAGHSSSTRNIVLSGIPSGSMCSVQARAEAGHNQVSLWSDPMVHMCT